MRDHHTINLYTMEYMNIDVFFEKHNDRVAHINVTWKRKMKWNKNERRKNQMSNQQKEKRKENKYKYKWINKYYNKQNYLQNLVAKLLPTTVEGKKLLQYRIQDGTHSTCARACVCV